MSGERLKRESYIQGAKSNKSVFDEGVGDLVAGGDVHSVLHMVEVKALEGGVHPLESRRAHHLSRGREPGQKGMWAIEFVMQVYPQLPVPADVDGLSIGVFTPNHKCAVDAGGQVREKVPGAQVHIDFVSSGNGGGVGIHGSREARIKIQPFRMVILTKTDPDFVAELLFGPLRHHMRALQGGVPTKAE